MEDKQSLATFLFAEMLYHVAIKYDDMLPLLSELLAYGVDGYPQSLSEENRAAISEAFQTAVGKFVTNNGSWLCLIGIQK